MTTIICTVCSDFLNWKRHVYVILSYVKARLVLIYKHNYISLDDMEILRSCNNNSQEI